MAKFILTTEAETAFRHYMREHPDVLAFENKAWGRPVLQHISEYLNYEFVQPNHREIRAKIKQRGGKIISTDIIRWAIDTAEEMRPSDYASVTRSILGY